jgi:hypothetical protein
VGIGTAHRRGGAVPSNRPGAPPLYRRRMRPATAAPPDTCRQPFGVAGEEICLASGLRSANVSSGAFTRSMPPLPCGLHRKERAERLVKPQDGPPQSRFRLPLRRPQHSGWHGFVEMSPIPSCCSCAPRFRRASTAISSQIATKLCLLARPSFAAVAAVDAPCRMRRKGWWIEPFDQCLVRCRHDDLTAAGGVAATAGGTKESPKGVTRFFAS